MISVKNLTKKFDDTKVLNDLSFQIKRGEIVGLLGPNGAGKTTTMRILTGFLSADEGKIEINGLDIDNPKQTERIKKIIGYLPEDNPLYPDMLVCEYLRMMSELKQIAKDQREKEIKKAVEKTGVGEVYYKQISNLSKGFRQRAGLAAAVLGNPEILILDEPTEGLDPNQRVDIRNLIKNLGKNKTVIISSHVLTEIENTCGRIIIINKGKIAADGITRDIIDGAQGKRMLNLEIEGEGVDKALAKLAGDKNIKIQEYKNNILKAVVEIEGGRELRPDIFNLAKKNDWMIWEMHQKEVSLEDVFRELTK